MFVLCYESVLHTFLSLIDRLRQVKVFMLEKISKLLAISVEVIFLRKLSRCFISKQHFFY